MSGFLAIQTQTGWGGVLQRFAEWCEPGCGSQVGGWVLDAGCGPGLLPRLFHEQGCRAVGVDLEAGAFRPAPLHHRVVQASVFSLPFAGGQFDLVTAVNLLFLLPEPEWALAELGRALRPGGRLALLNPSEQMSVAAARELAASRGLEGIARESLLNWARLAEAHACWSEPELRDLLGRQGLRLEHSALLVGPGLARMALAVKEG